MLKFLIVVQLQDYVIDSNMINDWFGKPKPLSCKMRVRVREGESQWKYCFVVKKWEWVSVNL